jgi:DedD protein
MSESPDPQLQLKKRARRRLVGAVAFAGLAAVVLPMVMDEEPKRPIQDVQIRIPGQDQVPFRPKELAERATVLPCPPQRVRRAARNTAHWPPHPAKPQRR